MDLTATATDIVLTVTLWAAAASITLQHDPREALTVNKRAGLLIRVAVLDVVLVPLFVWGLTQLLHMQPDQATGLLIVGAAAAGPIGLKATQIASGNTVLALQLVVLLELANLAVIPIWTTLLLSANAPVPFLDFVRPLVLLVLLPGLIGLVFRAARPDIAAQLSGPLRVVSNVGLVIVVVLVLAQNLSLAVASLGEGVPLIALLTVGFGLFGGWIAGSPNAPDRVAAGLVTGIRANAPALALAQAAFPGRPEVAVTIVVFGLISVVVPLLAATIVRARMPVDTPRALEISGAG